MLHYYQSVCGQVYVASFLMSCSMKVNLLTSGFCFQRVWGGDEKSSRAGEIVGDWEGGVGVKYREVK